MRHLFDFADLESYDPDGNYYLDRGCNDNCDYVGGNWAVEWCAAHPGHDLCVSCDCAHSQSLNCNVKARAFWWMMARLAGWDGPNSDPVPAVSDWGILTMALLLTAVGTVLVRRPLRAA